MEISEYDKEKFDDIIAGHGDWFGAQLIRLIAKADYHNRRLLETVYPSYVQFFYKWYNNS